jgi:hypothetical protein
VLHVAEMHNAQHSAFTAMFLLTSFEKINSFGTVVIFKTRLKPFDIKHDKEEQRDKETKQQSGNVKTLSSCGDRAVFLRDLLQCKVCSLTYAGP